MSNRQERLKSIEREARVKRAIVITVISLVVLVVVGVVGAVLVTAVGKELEKSAQTQVGNNGSEQSVATEAGNEEQLPSREVGNDPYFVAFGSRAAKHQMDLYVDFLCPYCGYFESVNLEDIRALIDNEEVYLRFFPVNFQDPNAAGTKYSTRAANAFLTAYRADPEAAWRFIELLNENQPAEGEASTMLSDEQLAQLGLEAGLSQDVVDSFSALSEEGWINAGNEQFLRDYGSTPTVVVDGVNLMVGKTGSTLIDTLKQGTGLPTLKEYVEGLS
ncbi:MAG: thioredoxin domain-containing protein [Propionibacteriaceae bacterium]|jgi:protein-disulfide isomerase|nr:thioredoxin domain-containing protein [Propionibacteriaceae bacterium]